MNRRRIALSLLQVAVAVALLVWVGLLWGKAPFVAAAAVLSWPAVVAALAMGAVGVVVQAQRWRLVAGGQGIELGVLSAIGRCWQAAFLNAVLPGGLAGDALRAVEQQPVGHGRRRETIKSSVGAVSAERLAGTSVVFLAVGIALLSVWPAAGGLGLLVGVAAGAAAWPWLRRLAPGDIGRVFGLSVVGWCAFAAMFVVSCLAVAPDLPAGHIPVLAAITLGGMSIPLNVAGWGPREGATAWGFMALGHPPEQGVAVSVAYGLLALVSVLPGSVVLLIRLLRGTRRRRPRRGEIELRADVLAQDESTHRSGEGPGQRIGSVEADSWDAVTHQ